MTDVYVFWSVLKRDPYLFVGIVVLGAPMLAHVRMYTSLQEVDFNHKHGFVRQGHWWSAMREYACTRREHHWPARPLHLIWISLLICIPLLILGILRL